MESSVLDLLLAVVLLLSFVLLTSLCLKCRRRIQHTSIPQHYDSNYRHSEHLENFRVVRQHVNPSSLNQAVQCTTSPLPGTSTRTSADLSENSSFQSYENQPGKDVDSNEEELENENGYIKVLPESPCICPSERSDNSDQPYINVEGDSHSGQREDSDAGQTHTIFLSMDKGGVRTFFSSLPPADSANYENVTMQGTIKPVQTPVLLSSSDSDSDDNYVNAPKEQSTAARPDLYS
ncbi:linker for activation of T-cells family member 1 isoform X1 [Denticeps clupeoides]|uniref:linker for activation of T-cells family member 1 isoform X1 n=1 Tax=Denticeps clupeoides TaxID=299321 RepID=UPI0010A3071F|nr:uncharacterized protein LOC114793723 isoform X1 [Denticeps clupeoides]XP_028841676.1 uncharacterized protein LOC114793723 isoform X1 [Denticeps clupeoides]XP_028841677.1 uncharacterized protein LOC114793723 isoform X1 [Denticeps clupeoides]